MPAPFHKWGETTFSKLMEMRRGGGVLKIFARKRWIRQNVGVSLEMGGGLPYYIKGFLEISHNTVYEKNLHLYRSFVKKNVLQNNCLNKI